MGKREELIKERCNAMAGAGRDWIEGAVADEWLEV